MNIFIFLIILAVLILAHEFGHFIVAKKSGIRVDEFGLGFPPRLWSKKVGETEYTINAIPFGGFVKIFGENPDEVSVNGPDAGRSFVHKPKSVQAAVIGAGIVFNLLLAWMLISAGFMIGLPSSADAVPAGKSLSNVALVITDVAQKSPAEEAGIKVGDKIVSLRVGDDTLVPKRPEEVQEFIKVYGGSEIAFEYSRGKTERGTKEVTPKDGIVSDRPAIGIAMDSIGTLRLYPHEAFWEGGKLTAVLTAATATGLYDFLKQAVTGEADFSQVAGPVGMVGMVGDAASFGFVYILTFMAIISINLAIINLIPFPALDGGRLFFLLIEKIKGSPIKPVVANTVNFVGFALLMLLMIVITYHDIAKIVVG